MKSVAKWMLTGIAVLMLAAPMTAQAQECRRFGYGNYWRHRDIAWDRHNLHAQYRDIARDRWALRQDIANGNWGAARAERADIRQDLMNTYAERRDLYRDYRGIPGPAHLPPAYAPVPRTNYVPPLNSTYGPGYPTIQALQTAPLSYPGGQGLGALLGGFVR